MFIFNERSRDTFSLPSFSREHQFCGNSFQMTFPSRAISRRECFSFLPHLITETFRKIRALREERRNSFSYNASCLRELAPSGASIEHYASLEKRASLTDVQSEIAAKFYEPGRFSWSTTREIWPPVPVDTGTVKHTSGIIPARASSVSRLSLCSLHFSPFLLFLLEETRKLRPCIICGGLWTQSLDNEFRT